MDVCLSLCGLVWNLHQVRLINWPYSMYRNCWKLTKCYLFCRRTQYIFRHVEFIRSHSYVLLLYDRCHGSKISKIHLVEEAFDHFPNGAIRCDFRPSIPIAVPRMQLSEIFHGLDWVPWCDVLVPVFWFLQSEIHIGQGQGGHCQWQRQQQWQWQWQWKREYLILIFRFGSFKTPPNFFIPVWVCACVWIVFAWGGG